MSNPTDTPLPNPEGQPLADANQNNHRKNGAVKRIFARLFARRKASKMAGNPMASAGNQLEEIHEMQVLQSDRTLPTELEEPQNIPIQEPEAEPVPEPQPQPQPEPELELELELELEPQTAT